MTVLHNVFIDEQRRRQVEVRHADALVRMHEETSPPAQEGQVRLAQIREAFATLPEEQRARAPPRDHRGHGLFRRRGGARHPDRHADVPPRPWPRALRAFEEGARPGRDAQEPPAQARSDRPPLRLVAGNGFPRRAAGDS